MYANTIQLITQRAAEFENNNQTERRFCLYLFIQLVFNFGKRYVFIRFYRHNRNQFCRLVLVIYNICVDN